MNAERWGSVVFWTKIFKAADRDIGKSTRIFANLFLTHFSDNTPLCRFYRFFLKIMNRDVDNKNSIHNSAKQVVLPVH